MSGRRRTRLNLVLAATLGISILVMVNYISSRHYARWDWTEHKVFTLSDQTKEALSSLDQEVVVFVFLARGEQDFADIETLIEEYVATTPNITAEWVDPDRDRARYQVLADRFGLDTWMAGDVTLSQVPVVVTSGDRKWKVERHQLILEDFDSFDDVDGHKLDLQSERALTGAILEVVSGRTTRICVAQGHGEWELGAVGERSLSPVVRELDWEKITAEPLEISPNTEVPASCDALFVVGPQRPFSEEEVERIDKYIGSGGNVLLALDPVVKKQRLQPTGFEESLRERGIVVGNDIVIEHDASRVLPGNPGDLFLVTDLSTHRLTDMIRRRGGGVLLAVAGSVEAEKGGYAEGLLHTSAQVRAETDLRQAVEADAKPTKGQAPVAVAVAWERVGSGAEVETETETGPGAVARAATDAAAAAEAASVPAAAPGTATDSAPDSAPGRLVVIGDSDWLSGELLDNPQLSNIDLLSSVAGWLTQREALIQIAPRKTKARAVIMSDTDLANVFFRVAILLPLAAMIAGFGVWWSRRS